MIVTALALGLALAAQPAVVGDPRQAFQRYREALLAKDGPAAAAAVDRETLAYYARMRDLALAGDAGTIRRLPVVDKLIVVRLRHEVGRATVERMDGAGLFAFGVERGWIDPASVRNAVVGSIRVDGDSATGEMKIDGRTAPPSVAWRFKREGGSWRFCLMPLVKLAEPSFRKVVEQSGLDENVFVLAVVGKVSGRPVPDGIWAPLRARGDE